jgi:hypothetical protein
MSAGQIMQGRLRMDVDPECHLPPDSKDGDYWKENGIWFGWCPNGERNLLCSLVNHTITEHEDGTITVSPSILCGPVADIIKAWHGYLERGVWREA